MNSNPLPFALSLVVLCVAATGCPKGGDAPQKEQTSPVAAPSASASGASATPPRPKSAVPTLAPELVEATKGFAYYPIQGAQLVVDGLRVGRVVDDKVEWIGKLEEARVAFGGSQITGAFGKWPDVDITFSSNNGRAAMPTIFPLTGSKGSSVTFGDGGGWGWISGWARVGATTIVSGDDGAEGRRFLTVRGPRFVLKPTPADKAGCKEGEVNKPYDGGAASAVAMASAAATEKGTLVTVGNLCGRDKAPVAEVWDQPGKSRIVPLDAWVKDLGFFPKLLPGKGDDLWIMTQPILHYHEGTFEPLPKTERALVSPFVSPSGKLHGIVGLSIVRFDAGKWTPIAKLSRPQSFPAIAMDEKETIWVSSGGAARLREVPDALADESCKTPFVYLYTVSYKNEAKYTFPTTRKALSTFPGVSDLSLVEYWDDGRRLGITVKSEAQGEAVIAHVKANMKDESPELICYDPKRPRVIDMNAAK